MNNLTKTYLKSFKLGSIVDIIHHSANLTNNCVKLLVHKALCVYYVKSLQGGCKALSYKTLAWILILGSLGNVLAYGEISYPVIDLSAISKIESSNNPEAINRQDNGGIGSYGLCQISPYVLSDFNKAHKTSFNLPDLLLEPINRRIADWYVNFEIPRLIAFYRKKGFKLQDDLITRLSFYNLKHNNVLRGKRAYSYYAKYRRALYGS